MNRLIEQGEKNREVLEEEIKRHLNMLDEKHMSGFRAFGEGLSNLDQKVENLEQRVDTLNQ